MALAIKQVSPVGEIMYPKLRTPEMYEGKPTGFSIQMKYSKDDKEAQQLVALVDELFEKAQSSEDFRDDKGKQKVFSKDPSFPYRTDENGDYLFKFKTNHEARDKDGKPIIGDDGKPQLKVIPVVDTKGNKIDKMIGNGSLGRISFIAKPYWNSSKINGIKFYLGAIQIVSLIEYQGGSNFGFKYEDEENPFGN